MNAGDAMKAFIDDYQKDLDDLKRHTQTAADIMTDLYGGRWNIDINHESRFIMIGREIESDAA